MSAPKHAEPLGLDGWIDQKTGKECDKSDFPKVKCECGFRGGVWELLGVDEEDTMWCPRCRTAGGWMYV